jgi:hypothetical protein
MNPIHESPHLGSFKAVMKIGSDTATLMGWGTGIGIHLEFTTPLFHKSAYHDAHRTEDEAEEHDNVHANCDT